MKKSIVKNISFLVEKLTNLKFILLLLLITCFLAYGLSLDMYFWKDDFALMIKAQHPEEPVGFFGPGIKGDGAYRYITIPFTVLYPYLGLNAWAYFLIGILLYYVAAIGLFILALEVFEDRFKAFLTALIFSSGFIGADSIFGLTNSYQTSWVIFFLTICLTLFIKSFKPHNLGLYILSVFSFVMSVETGFIRAHGFFLIILSTVFLFVDKNAFKKIPEFFLKIIPFFLIFKFFYLNSDPAQVGLAQFSKSLESGKYDYFFNPLITFVNVFLSTPIIKWSLSIVNRVIGRNIDIVKYQLVLLFIFLLSVVLLTGFLLLKKQLIKKYSENRRNLSVLFFSLSLTLGSFIGVFYIGAASSYLESTHRYLSTTLIGVSFFWVSFFSLLLSNQKSASFAAWMNGSHKNLPEGILRNLIRSSSFFFVKYKDVNSRILVLVAVLAISLSYLILGNLYAVESINNRTKPQKEFFAQLKKEMPAIKKKTFLYFEVSNKNNSNGKFGNIFGAGSVGGSAEITMHYPGVDRYEVFTSISDFADFTKKINKEKGSIENSYWFYFENNKLINRTPEFREILKNGKTTLLGFDKEIVHNVKAVKKNSEFELEDTSLELTLPKRVPSLTDGLLKFNLTIIPQNTIQDESNQLSDIDKSYLEYLLTKAQIKKTSKVKVLNYFQNNYPQNLFDGKLETNWMADRGPWHNIIHGITDQIQFIEISLDSPINLGGILLTNGHSLRTPTAYKILVKENKNWKVTKETRFTEAKNTNQIWFDKIDPVFTNSIRIELLSSSSGDAPQLAEIELVEEQFSNLDFEKAQEIETDPAILLRKNPMSSLVKDYFGQNGKISFLYLSNKDNDYNVPVINFNIKGFNKPFSYEIPVPSSGIGLTKLKFFNLNFPAEYIFSDLEYVNPSLDKLISK